jgi:D-alanyl-D-alanine carboxypeptidase
MTTSVLWREWVPFEALAEDGAAGPPSSDRLQWDGATAEQLDFMRRVYDRHVKNASAQRSFVPSVSTRDLATVENGQRMRAAAAGRCRAMLTAGREALAAEQAQSKEAPLKVKEFGARSGYRSVETQFSSWERTFRTKYYPDTQAQREKLEGGAHGPAAVTFMARYVGGRLGAPGFSLHNNGLAMDFFTKEGKTELGPNTNAASIAGWRASWLFGWLSQRAAEFQFFQNTQINEPWHWEFRAAAAPTEATVTAGRLQIDSAPPLSAHKGTPPDLILHWNDMASVPDVVDIVVHLHGFSKHGVRMRLDVDKEPDSGLDFTDPAAPGTVGRTRPTLGILPRGAHIEGSKYDFPALQTSAGLDALIDYALAQFATAVGAATMSRGRFLLTAHSGGGKTLASVLSFADPDEVHVFDALYWSADSLIRWVRRRLARDIAAVGNSGAAPVDAGACRVVFTEPPPEKNGTKPQSLAVHRALQKVWASSTGAESVLGSRYRVQRTGVGHPDIPRRYGWRLLADAGVTLPKATAP